MIFSSNRWNNRGTCNIIARQKQQFWYWETLNRSIRMQQFVYNFSLSCLKLMRHTVIFSFRRIHRMPTTIIYVTASRSVSGWNACFFHFNLTLEWILAKQAFVFCCQPSPLNEKSQITVPWSSIFPKQESSELLYHQGDPLMDDPCDDNRCRTFLYFCNNDKTIHQLRFIRGWRWSKSLFIEQRCLYDYKMIVIDNYSAWNSIQK
jgi:hypothetical protein